MHTEVDAKYHRFTWFGRGQHDTYWGRDNSALVAVYSSDVSEQDNFVRPQEHGNKRDLRWLTLADDLGRGIRVDHAHSPFSASVWPYSLEELQKASHIHELPAHRHTTLNIDFLQNGLGDCFVPCPDCYKLKPHAEYQHSFILSILSQGE
jgi:beta-galactosidase